MTSKKSKSCQKGTVDFSDMRVRRMSPSIDQLSQRVGSLQIRRDLFPRNHEIPSYSGNHSNPQNPLPSYTTHRPPTSISQKNDSFTRSFSLTSNTNLKPQYRGKDFVSRVRNNCFYSISNVVYS